MCSKLVPESLSSVWQVLSCPLMNIRFPTIRYPTDNIEIKKRVFNSFFNESRFSVVFLTSANLPSIDTDSEWLGSKPRWRLKHKKKQQQKTKKQQKQ